MITGPISNNNAGMAAFSRFFSGNTWTAQQIFVSPTTTSPGAVFQANGTISAIPASEANVTAMFQGTEAVQSYTMFSSSAQQINVLFRRRQGTYASPTAVQSGNILGAVQWQGYGVSTFGSVPAAQIRAVALQAFTEAARGTSLEFYTTATGTITQQLTFVIEPTLVYSPVALQGFASVRSNAASGISKNFRLATSTSPRWEFIANATAESSTATGCDFEFRRYNNSGADLGLVMAVTRSTGDITFNGGGGTTTFSANQIRITTTQTPASATATGTAGTICWDASYIYVCTATDTWKRVAIATWP